LTSLLLLLYSDPPPDIPWRDILVSNKNVFTQILILPSVRLWHQTTAAVHRADSCLTSGGVSCCDRMQRLEFVVHNFTIMVRCADDTEVKQEAGQLLSGKFLFTSKYSEPCRQMLYAGWPPAWKTWKNQWNRKV